MSHIENFRIKDWVVILSIKEEEDTEFGFMPVRRRKRNYPINGRPLRIVAMSMPFVAVTDGEKRFSLDIRDCELGKVSQQYVRAFHQTNRIDAETQEVYFIKEQGVIKSKKEKKKDQRGCCPTCGYRLRERLKGPGIWIWFCKQCGFEGGQTNDADQ